MRVFTIGHSTRTVAELVALLQAHGVTTLVDVRSIRRSRTNPQFDAGPLSRALANRGIGYHAIAALGGRRGKAKQPPALANDAWQVSAFRNYADHALTAEFRAGLRELLALPAPAAVMCAEAVWWRCHRRIIADHLLARRVRVFHIMSKTSAPAATLTPFAVVERGRVHYPLTAAGAAGAASERVTAAGAAGERARRPSRAVAGAPRARSRPRRKSPRSPPRTTTRARENHRAAPP